MSERGSTQLESDLFNTDRRVFARDLKDLYEQTVHYQPQIEAEGIDNHSLKWYSDLIGERIHKLPQFVGDVSNRLKGYASSFGNRLKSLVYKVKREDPNLGGYFNSETEETVYNGTHAETNPKFARHSITHEMFHLLQKVTGAIRMYSETLSDHYGKLYGEVGRKLEGFGFNGIGKTLENYGRIFGMYRARVAIEGNASDLTSVKEGEETEDAYRRSGWVYAMRKAREDLGVGVVTAPQTRQEVLKVDRYLSLVPALA